MIIYIIYTLFDTKITTWIFIDLAGKTDVDEALVGMIVDGVSDMFDSFVKTKFGSDEDAKVGVQINCSISFCNLKECEVI